MCVCDVTLGYVRRAPTVGGHTHCVAVTHDRKSVALLPHSLALPTVGLLGCLGSRIHCVTVTRDRYNHFPAVCCAVLQSVVRLHRVMVQCVTACYSVLQGVEACCSVL